MDAALYIGGIVGGFAFLLLVREVIARIMYARWVRRGCDPRELF